MSLGISVDIVKAAVEAADIVIAQINPQMPWSQATAFTSVEEVDHLVYCDEPLLSTTTPSPTRSPGGSAATSLGSSRTVPPSRSGTARSPTPS